MVPLVFRVGSGLTTAALAVRMRDGAMVCQAENSTAQTERPAGWRASQPGVSRGIDVRLASTSSLTAPLPSTGKHRFRERWRSTCELGRSQRV